MSQYLKSHHHRGALLIEALLSILILSISLTLIIQSFLSQLRITSRNNSLLLAYMAIESTMDGLILKSLNHEPIQAMINQSSEEPYQFAITLEPLDNSDTEQALKRIELVTTWKERNSTNRLALKTLLLDSVQKN